MTMMDPNQSRFDRPVDMQAVSASQEGETPRPTPDENVDGEEPVEGAEGEAYGDDEADETEAPEA